MNTYKSILKCNSVLVGFYLILGIITVFLETYNVSVFKDILDSISNNQVNLNKVIIYSLLLILGYLLVYIDNYPSTKLSEKIYLDFKINAINKMKVIDYNEYQKLGTGKLLQIIENGSNAGRNILFNYKFRIIRELLPSVIFSLFFIAMIDKRIMLMILIGYIFVFAISNILLKYLYSIKKNVLINEEDLSRTLIRGFMELIVFRVYRRYDNEIKKSYQMSKSIINGKTKMRMIHEAFFTIFAILIGFIKIIIICSQFLNLGLNVGEVVALLTLVDKAYSPIAIFNVLYVQKKLDQVAYDRYDQVLKLPNDNGLFIDSINDLQIDNIELKDICFSYEGKNIVKDINIKIKLGKSLAFVGESGSGKSTIVKLILGFLKNTKGNITINGKDLSNINLNELYKKVTYISQDSPIFDGTVRENICFNNNVDDHLIMKALEQVKLKDLILSLEKGLDSEVGEKGFKLSGGERQRLALARVFLDDSSIIILDEATSAMDNITESIVMDNILQNLQNKTLIIIAHRLTTVEKIDTIYVLKESHIVESGTFNELLENSTYFKDLWFSSQITEISY